MNMYTLCSLWLDTADVPYFDEISIRRIPSCVKVKATTYSSVRSGVSFRENEQTKILEKIYHRKRQNRLWSCLFHYVLNQK